MNSLTHGLINSPTYSTKNVLLKVGNNSCQLSKEREKGCGDG